MNDHGWRAELLAQKLNDRGKGWVHVNPIPLNPTPGSVWTASTPEQTDIFVSTLEKNGIPPCAILAARKSMVLVGSWLLRTKVCKTVKTP
jgi:adenine C2-methylase RlmN of 23S rRNA A2503 and tRNA A37